jgi:hypothetical protein
VDSVEDVFVKGLRSLASDLDSITVATSDRYHYDAITESIRWEDELPQSYGRGGERLAALRVIFRYRASLILGEPQAEWERYWQLARELFPRWIGFDATRLNPSPEVREFLRAHAAETAAAVARSIERMRRR